MNPLTNRRRFRPMAIALGAVGVGAALLTAPALSQSGTTKTITVPAETVIEQRNAIAGDFQNCSTVVFARWAEQPNTVPGSSAKANYTFRGEPRSRTVSGETTAQKPKPYDNLLDTGSSLDDRPRIFEAPSGFNQIYLTIGAASGPNGWSRCSGDLATFQRESYVVTGVEVLVRVASTPTNVRCAGRLATIVGTNKRDVLRGTRGRDVIAGLGGNDRILGLGGNDIICGGPGRDVIVGGAGNDQMYGEGGNDVLSGQAGRDLLWGQAGRDRILGGPGNDLSYGGADRDVINGQAGRNVNHGGPGKDVCRNGRAISC